MKTRTLLSVLLALCSLPAAVRAADAPTGHFTGMAEVATRQGTRSISFDIVVSRPLSMAEALPFKAALERGGQQALLALLRQSASGRFKLGDLEYPINLIVAEPVSGGYDYVVVTTRNFRYEEVNQGQPSLDFPFAAAAFTALEFGSGEGTIYPQAALSIGADGLVKVEAFEGRTGRLKDVRRR